MIEKYKCTICKKIFRPEESTARAMTAAYCSVECQIKGDNKGILFPRFEPVLDTVTK